MKTTMCPHSFSIPQSIKSLLCGLLPSFLLSGCGKQDMPNAGEKPDRTILVYMAANNDLKYDALRSLDQMEEGYREEHGTLLAFVKTDRRSSHILRIREDHRPGILASDTLKSYASENSSAPDFMGTVFADMKVLAPSPSGRYGVVLWSHGTAWMPDRAQIAPFAFGYDRGRELDIKELKHALPVGLDFILFDACYMASIEVLYELRDRARHIIASSAEVLSTSFPYREVLPQLFAGDLEKACTAYHGHYAGKSGAEQSATVSLIATEHLTELAETTRECLENHYDADGEPKLRNVQDFNFARDFSLGFYDYLGFFEENTAPDAIGAMKHAFGKCVRLHLRTPRFLDKPIGRFSGVTLSLPDNPGFVQYYKTLDWSAASGFGRLLR